MKSKVMSVFCAAVMGVSAVAMPVVANAEASATYVTHSDFSDCSVGGSKGLNYYGLNIILDGGPWLKKGSSDIQAETWLRDEANNLNYCNFYANCEKGGSYGAGSYYVYQRDTTANYTKEYGLFEFMFRMKGGTVQLMMGDFTDATSNTDYIAGNLTFTETGITAMDGTSTKSVASISTDKWYKIRIVIDNKLQEYSIAVVDAATGKTVGSLDGAGYYQKQATGIRTYCFGYIKNAGSLDFDMTDVTIEKHNTKPDLM